MKKQLLKVSLVVFGAVSLSTIGIFASDVLQGVAPNIGNLANVADADICKKGAVEFKGPSGLICVDIYEATPSEDCPNHVLRNKLHSEQNLSSQNCYAVSKPDAAPWSFISLTQAQRACAFTGKRLPTNEEWYRIALSTQIENCVTDAGGVEKTGTEACVTAQGVYDMIGNVWEWVDTPVDGVNFEGRVLPETGYVSQVDANGIAVSSSDAPDSLYGEDYFWSKENGVFGMIRGGFYDSGTDAGLYATNASVPTDFAAQGVGFRCVEDIM